MSNAADFDLINAIADRAMQIITRQGFGSRIDKLTVLMDVSAVHAHTPLRLADLLGADAFNFAHDVLGIIQHMDRATGRLDGFFNPRFANKPTTPEGADEN